MAPLTIEDLLPLQEYASRRKEFFDTHRRYLDRFRRVKIGPRLTLIFENRQTLWYRVQEVIRVGRLTKKADVEQELDLYNRLLPCHDRLQAALLIDIVDQLNYRQEISTWQNLHGEHLRLRVGDTEFPADLITNRPEDRSVGTAHWIQIHIPDDQRQVLGSTERPAHFRFDNGIYRQNSLPLSEDLRLSLLDDLEIAEREMQHQLA